MSKCNEKCTHKNPFIHPLVKEYHGKKIIYNYEPPGIGEYYKINAYTFGLGTILGLQSYFHKRKAVHYPQGVCAKGKLQLDHDAQKFFNIPFYTKKRKVDGKIEKSKTKEFPIYIRHTHNMFHEHSLQKGPKSLSICSPFMDFTMLSGEACPFWDFKSFIDFMEFQKTRSSSLLASQPCLWNSALCIAPCYSYLECNYYSMITYDYKEKYLIRFRCLPLNQETDTKTIGSPVYQSFKELCFANFYKPEDEEKPKDFLNTEYLKRDRRTYVIQYAKLNKTDLCKTEVKHRRNAAVPWYDCKWENFGFFEIFTKDIEIDSGKSRFTNKLSKGFSLATPESLTDPAAIAWMRSMIYPWMSCLRP